MVARNRSDGRDAGLPGCPPPPAGIAPRSIMTASVLPGAPTSTHAGLQRLDSYIGMGVGDAFNLRVELDQEGIAVIGKMVRRDAKRLAAGGVGYPVSQDEAGLQFQSLKLAKQGGAAARRQATFEDALLTAESIAQQQAFHAEPFPVIGDVIGQNVDGAAAHCDGGALLAPVITAGGVPRADPSACPMQIPLNAATDRRPPGG